MKINESYFSNIEGLIRAGKIGEARKLMSNLDPKTLPRPLRLRAGNLCRRSDMVTLGLKVLGPLVHFEKGRWRTDATPQELAEYAVLVQKSGAVREAAWILRQVDVTAVPEALLYRAYCHMHLWEYDQAVVCLESYEQINRAPYQTLVSRVNRSAALIALERNSEALQLLNEALTQAESPNCLRLRANCLELRAQVEIVTGAMTEARSTLTQARRLFEGNPASDHFYFEKWSAIIEGLEAKSVSPLNRMHKEAMARRQFESARTLDRFMLRIRFEDSLFQHLLFGTPYSTFRSSLLAEYKGRRPTPTYIIGESSAPTFDLKSGRLHGTVGIEDPSRKVHALFNALFKDFYTPMSAGALFSELFPGEFFDYSTSFHRVYQIVYRARKWLEESHFPVKIDLDDGRFSLRVTGAFGFVIPFYRTEVSTTNLRLEELVKLYADRPFTPSQGASALNLSPTTFRDLMRLAVESGLVERLGKGPATRYQILNRSVKSA